MKSLRIVTLAAFVVLSTAQAHADSIPSSDPKIIQGGDPSSSPTFITSPAFYIVTPLGTSPATNSPCVLFESFSGTIVNAGTSPNCFFANGINLNGVGQNITELVFDVLKPGGLVSCELLNNIDFAMCVPGPFDDGGAMVTFKGGPGIPFQGEFHLGFQGFPENTPLGCSPISTCPQNVTISPIPEPGTLVLFVGGVGALLARRRLRAHNHS
jgi:hypothetical protein